MDLAWTNLAILRETFLPYCKIVYLECFVSFVRTLYLALTEIKLLASLYLI